MDEKKYRVVRADGSVAPGCGQMTLTDARYAWERANKDGGYAPYRVQELVLCGECGRGEWRDVPEPEPLPDLPETVYGVSRGDYVATRSPDRSAPLTAKERAAGWRQFEGRVEWVEVTDGR